jgi:hypothetical protein
MNAQVRHDDGTVCAEGTRRVPRAFKACCAVFAARVTACHHDIRYEWWARRKGWFIAIAEAAGGGGIAISFCLHCGTRLSPQPRRRSGTSRPSRS